MKHVPAGKMITKIFDQVLERAAESKLALTGFVDAHPDIELQPGEQIKISGHYTITVVPPIEEEIQAIEQKVNELAEAP